MQSQQNYIGGGRRPNTQNTTANTTPITNKIQAISIAIPATPVMPNRAAIIAITKKVIAKFIMRFLLIFMAPEGVLIQHTNLEIYF